MTLGTPTKDKVMSKLALSVAVGNYDRVRPLMDGTVQIDGVDPVFMNLPPEEIFFRAFRSRDFDICELSLSSFGEDRRGQLPLCGRAGIRVARLPSQLDLCTSGPHKVTGRSKGQTRWNAGIP